MDCGRGYEAHKCVVCSIKFRSKRKLYSHMGAHLDEGPFLCTGNECGKTFSCISDLVTHQKSNAGKKHVCTACNQEFFFSWTLKRHYYLSHTNNEKHNERHDNRNPRKECYVCLMCRKEFQDTYSLRGHYETHNDEIGYKELFPSPETRKIAREKRFVCTICTGNLHFHNADMLLTHNMIHHTTEKNPKIFESTETSRVCDCPCGIASCEFNSQKDQIHYYITGDSEGCDFSDQIPIKDGNICVKAYETDAEEVGSCVKFQSIGIQVDDDTVCQNPNFKKTFIGVTCCICKSDFINSYELEEHQKNHCKSLLVESEIDLYIDKEKKYVIDLDKKIYALPWKAISWGMEDISMSTVNILKDFGRQRQVNHLDLAEHQCLVNKKVDIHGIKDKMVTSCLDTDIFPRYMSHWEKEELVNRSGNENEIENKCYVSNEVNTYNMKLKETVTGVMESDTIIYCIKTISDNANIELELESDTKMFIKEVDLVEEKMLTDVKEQHLLQKEDMSIVYINMKEEIVNSGERYFEETDIDPLA